MPSGWIYTGSYYMNWEEETSEEHPSMEDLIKTYLEEENAVISDFNSNVDSL